MIEFTSKKLNKKVEVVFKKDLTTIKEKKLQQVQVYYIDLENQEKRKRIFYIEPKIYLIEEEGKTNEKNFTEVHYSKLIKGYPSEVEGFFNPIRIKDTCETDYIGGLLVGCEGEIYRKVDENFEKNYKSSSDDFDYR